MSLLKIAGSYQNPLLVGIAVTAGLIGCSSGNNGTGASPGGDQGAAAGVGAGAPGYGGSAPSYGGTAPSFGGTAPSYGGTAPSYGGTAPSFGGTGPTAGGTGPTAGGTGPTAGGTGPTAGGTGPTAGGTGPTAGGTGPTAGGTGPGSGGSPATGGGGGTTTLATCDGTMESSAHPITQACGTFITATGTTIKLGPLGAKMDTNVGKGFETTDGVSGGSPSDAATCPAFVALFNENATLSAQLQDVGTQPCTANTPNTGGCLNMALYSVYYPATWPEGPIPVLTWGNGTCAQPEGYGPLLRYIASYGFFIVAANSREVGTGGDLSKAIDMATAANTDSTSPYFGHLDLTRVGAMGHSQGCAAAADATEADSRIKAAILYNGVDSLTDSKPYLALSGDMDITGFTAASMGTAINGASGPAAFLYYHNPSGQSGDTLKGHLVLMLTPERVAPASAAWWQMIFNNDATAKQMFIGSSCGLCSDATDYAYGEKGLM